MFEMLETVLRSSSYFIRRARLANVERQQSSKSSWAPKAHSDPAGNLDPRKDRSSNDINGTPTLTKSVLNRNAALVRRETSVLPELNSRVDFITDNPDSTGPDRDACLPELDKEGRRTGTASKRLNAGHLHKERTIIIHTPDKQGDINREVEYVKSAWRALQQGQNWTKEKADVCTSKGHAIIGEMTRDIDRLQKRHLRPGANRYLRKSATDVLQAAASRPSLERDVEIARRIIFPKRRARFESAGYDHPSNLDLIDEDTTPALFGGAASTSADERSSGDNLSPGLVAAKTRSVHTNVHARGIVDGVRWCEKQDTGMTFKGDGAQRTSVRASIEKYLQDYIGRTRKLPDVEADERLRDAKVASDIAGTLASLDIGSPCFYGKCENTCGDTERSAREDIEENRCSDTSADVVGRSKDTFSPENNLELVDAKLAGTWKQSNATACEDHAFIKTGLDILNKSVLTNKLSQILRSEYLRKDLLL
ncbi:hypothetical protein EAI_03426 [Harpegnathos saltator]|uniref:Uncharacterized protein n=1 Tax=Harpegnathos saltator TaxID=610380 RepID=E2BI16_HARSA|nr:hypothetical protein EAI_03426 [Harpegnathos saltator]